MLAVFEFSHAYRITVLYQETSCIFPITTWVSCEISQVLCTAFCECKVINAIFSEVYVFPTPLKRIQTSSTDWLFPLGFFSQNFPWRDIFFAVVLRLRDQDCQSVKLYRDLPSHYTPLRAHGIIRQDYFWTPWIRKVSFLKILYSRKEDLLAHP